MMTTRFIFSTVRPFDTAMGYRHHSSRSGRQTASWPETGFGEIKGDLLEADFWTGMTSGLPVIQNLGSPPQLGR